MNKPGIKKNIPYLAAFLSAAAILVVAFVIKNANIRRQELPVTVTSATEIVTAPRTETTSDFPTLPPVTEDKAIPPEDESSSLLGYTEDFLSDSHSVDGIVLVSKTVSYPVFSGDGPVETINRSVRGAALTLSSVTQTEKEEADDEFAFSGVSGIAFEGITHVTGYTTIQKNSALSVLFETVVLNGGANTHVTHRALCFDVRNGNVISLDQFTGRDKDTVLSFVKSRFRALISSEPDIYYDNATEMLDISLSLYDFYITDTGVAVFIKSGEISPAAYGDATVDISFEEL